jgi:hypothetical protein
VLTSVGNARCRDILRLCLRSGGYIEVAGVLVRNEESVSDCRLVLSRRHASMSVWRLVVSVMESAIDAYGTRDEPAKLSRR